MGDIPKYYSFLDDSQNQKLCDFFRKNISDDVCRFITLSDELDKLKLQIDSDIMFIERKKDLFYKKDDIREDNQEAADPGVLPIEELKFKLQTQFEKITAQSESNANEPVDEPTSDSSNYTHKLLDMLKKRKPVYES